MWCLFMKQEAFKTTFSEEKNDKICWSGFIKPIKPLIAQVCFKGNLCSKGAFRIWEDVIKKDGKG